ncbi:hypothetical protein ACFV2X_38240 [Streptomyces sp. NPDC059679]|uniref:hypothetical protein n=1 Tax=Streptomyces sp. NPDC059679 TaxID=3346903 RepID=UPI0036967FBD
MPELRLTDPNGYDAVTTGYRIVVDPQQVDAESTRLRTEVAPQHATEHAYAGYDPRDYRVQVA